MSERERSTLHPAELPRVPRTASERDLPTGSPWGGKTYYGRPQLKHAPFNNWVVGGYIFLAGLSGSGAIIGTLADMAGGADGRWIGRRSRYLGILAPTVGSVLLVWDLHTPKRFYNMLRVAKGTSPMSIGTWVLMTYSLAALPSAAAQGLADLRPARHGFGIAAQALQPAAALAGAGLSVYTAALLSATSTPIWAASPHPLALRYAASSMASASAALALGRGAGRDRAALATITAAALVVETAATVAQEIQFRRKGIADAKRSAWGRVETVAALGIGTLLPLGLLAWARVAKGARRRAAIADGAALAVLGGSAMLRVSVLGLGDVSAKRPEISFRFAAPDNLPRDVVENDEPATGPQPLPYPAG